MTEICQSGTRHAGINSKIKQTKREKNGCILANSCQPPQFRHLTPTYDTQTQSSIVKPRVMCYSQPCLVLLWEESVPLSRPFKWWPAWTVSHESSVQCVCGRPWFWIAGVVGWHFACFVLTHFQILDLVCTHYCPISFCLKFSLFFLSFSSTCDNPHRFIPWCLVFDCNLYLMLLLCLNLCKLLDFCVFGSSSSVLAVIVWPVVAF